MKDLIALAKSSDKPLTYGSAGGIGTIQHFVAEMFSQRAGIKMLHVPYKGQGQALSALLSGEIQVMFLQPPVGVDFVKMGKLKALGFCGASRWSILPDVPTLSESGLPDFQIHGSYQGAIAPARTPRPILAKLHAEIKNTLNAQPVRDFFAAAGWEADGRGPDEFSAFLASELKRFGEIARVANIRIN